MRIITYFQSMRREKVCKIKKPAPRKRAERRGDSRDGKVQSNEGTKPESCQPDTIQSSARKVSVSQNLLGSMKLVLVGLTSVSPF